MRRWCRHQSHLSLLPSSLALPMKWPKMTNSPWWLLVCLRYIWILTPWTCCLCSTVVLRHIESEFKQAARQRRFICRDFVFVFSSSLFMWFIWEFFFLVLTCRPLKEGEDPQTTLRNLSRKRDELRSDLLVWCRVWIPSLCLPNPSLSLEILQRDETSFSNTHVNIFFRPRIQTCFLGGFTWKWSVCLSKQSFATVCLRDISMLLCLSTLRKRSHCVTPLASCTRVWAQRWWKMMTLRRLTLLQVGLPREFIHMFSWTWNSLWMLNAEYLIFFKYLWGVSKRCDSLLCNSFPNNKTIHLNVDCFPQSQRSHKNAKKMDRFLRGKKGKTFNW